MDAPRPLDGPHGGGSEPYLPHETTYWQFLNTNLQASNFGHTAVVELLLTATDNPVDLDAVNIRGQRAEDVAASRGHEAIAAMIARQATHLLNRTLIRSFPVLRTCKPILHFKETD